MPLRIIVVTNDRKLNTSRIEQGMEGLGGANLPYYSFLHHHLGNGRPSQNYLASENWTHFILIFMPACYCSTMSLAAKRSFIPGLTPTQVVPVSSWIPFLAFDWSHTGIWFLQKFFLVLTNAFGIIFLHWTFFAWLLSYCIGYHFLAMDIIFLHFT